MGGGRLSLVAWTGLGLLAACARPSDGDPAAAAEHVEQKAPATERLRAATGVDWLVDVDPKHTTPDLAVPKSAPPAWIRPGESPVAAAVRFFDELGDVFVPAKQLDAGRAKALTDERGMTHVKLRSVDDAASGYTVHFAPGGAIAFVNGVFASSSAAPPPDPRTTTFHFQATGKGVRFFPPISDSSDVKPVDASNVPGQDGWFLLTPAEGQIPSVRTHPPANGGEVAPFHSADGLEWDPQPAGTPGAGAAVDAHEHTLQVLRWYDRTLKWNQFGQPTAGIDVIVHATPHGGSDPWDGASFDNGTVRVGDGTVSQGGGTLPYAGLSVLAHEITHGVTAATSALGFLGDSGAVNETMSDVFSILIQHDLTGSTSMQVGSDVTVSGSPDRDLIHPRRGESPQGQEDASCGLPAAPPDHASQRYTGTCDSGGVHANIGIGGNAFALMTVGGKNDTSNLGVSAPLGWEGSRDLWWFSERFVLMFGLTFSELARWQLASAKALGLPLEPVACAWVATGVLDPAYVAQSWDAHCGS